MSNDSQDGPAPGEPSEADEKSSTEPNAFWNAFFLLRNRVLAGFVVALPVIITFIIIKWLYEFLAKDVIGYTARALINIWTPNAGQTEFSKSNTGIPEVDAVADRIRVLTGEEWVINNILAPVTAILLIIGLLFMLGMVFRSRWHRFFDWMMSSVPGVGMIYKSVVNVVDSLRQSGPGDTKKFQRVVLVKFPHPGMKVPAFVTSSCLDVNTGKEILCIYVPTTPLPTSGYMLLVPAEEVTEISWDLQTTLQAIVSGGITVPDRVEYSIGVINSPMLAGNAIPGHPTAVPPGAFYPHAAHPNAVHPNAGQAGTMPPGTGPPGTGPPGTGPPGTGPPGTGPPGTVQPGSGPASPPNPGAPQANPNPGPGQSATPPENTTNPGGSPTRSSHHPDDPTGEGSATHSQNPTNGPKNS